MKLDPIRVLALDILLAVGRGRHLEPELDRAYSGLTERRDRAFLAELVLGSLQWRGRYDYLIDRFVRRKRPDDPVVVEVLRLGLHQLIALDSVPPYAAIDQTAELTRKKLGPRKVGFVNGFLQAVRRKLQRGDGDDAALGGRLEAEFAELQEGSAAWIAAWHSHPQWLVDRWVGKHGLDTARGMCAWNNRSVPLDLAILDRKLTAADWSDRLKTEGFDTEPLPGGCGLRATDRWGRERVGDLLREHPDLIVQDATVQEATSWLLSAPQGTDQYLNEILPGGPVLDMCAAPGGKTARLDRSLDRDRAILALEPVKGRMGLLRENLTRIGSTRVFPLRGDGLKPPLKAGSMAGVLLDGPCTGTGVLRRHPEARWRLRDGWITERASLLRRLADQAVDLLAPGGVLMYATCSVEPEENEQVVEALLQDDRRLSPLYDDDGRWHRLWVPHLAAGDGFFAARLRIEG